MKKEKKQPDIEQLLSSYIDGRLSDRSRTEVKRLIRHDKEMAAKLRSMQRLKQILNAMPVATAPKFMPEDVKAALERRFLLGKSQQKDESAGARHLLTQRLLTAAVFIGFLGVFGWVIFNIITPAPAPQDTVAQHRPAAPAAPAELRPTTAAIEQPFYKSLTQSRPFHGTLLLTTNQPIEVNSFLKKAIYGNGLIDNTVPRQQGQNRSYDITCPTDAIVTLIENFGPLWEQIESTSLTMFGDSMESGIRIDNIRSSQLIALLSPNTPVQRKRLAKDFARLNDAKDSAPGPFPLESLPAGEVLTIPIKPVLTAEIPTPTAPETDHTENAKITITVISL